MAMAFVIAYSFSTDYFPIKSKEYKDHYATYTSIINERDSLLVDAVKGTDLALKIKSIKQVSNQKLRIYTKKKKQIKIKDSVLGYTSFKYFILGTSMPLLSFFISSLLLYIILKYIHLKKLRKYYLIISYVLIVTSGYWLFWSLLWFSQDPKRPFDLPKVYYNLAVYILPSLIFFSLYYLFKYLKTAEEKRKQFSKKIYHQIIVNNEQYLRLDSVVDYYKDNIEMFANIERKNSTKQLSIFNRLLIFIKKNYGK